VVLNGIIQRTIFSRHPINRQIIGCVTPQHLIGLSVRRMMTGIVWVATSDSTVQYSETYTDKDSHSPSQPHSLPCSPLSSLTSVNRPLSTWQLANYRLDDHLGGVTMAVHLRLAMSP